MYEGGEYMWKVTAEDAIKKYERDTIDEILAESLPMQILKVSKDGLEPEKRLP